MSKYKVISGDSGKWALVLEATGKAAIVFDTFERAADFVSRLSSSDRTYIDVTAVEALQPPAHGLVGDPTPQLAVPLADGNRITCPQCGAQYTYVVQAGVTQLGTKRSIDDTSS